MFIIALAGVFVTAASETAVGSRFGSAVMSGGLGLLLGPTLGYFTETDIVKSLVGAALVVAAFGIVGAIVTSKLQGWWSILMWLTGAIIAGLLTMPMLATLGFSVEGGMQFLDWVILLVFSGWVVFDMNDAVRMDRNAKNASDAAAAIYLDFLNIYLVVLDTLGNAASVIWNWFADTMKTFWAWLTKDESEGSSGGLSGDNPCDDNATRFVSSLDSWSSTGGSGRPYGLDGGSSRSSGRGSGSNSGGSWTDDIFG